MSELDSLLQQAIVDCGSASDLVALDTVRVNYLGKNGKFTELLKQIKQLPPESRADFGAKVNQVKTDFQTEYAKCKDKLLAVALANKLNAETIDVSMPGRGPVRGSVHPVNLSIARIEDYFSKLGFAIVEGPEIEDAHYNFTMLNIPENHPSRAMHDTFYFNADLLLRTHTSPVQVRIMQEHEPPFKLISPGKVFRCDSDVTHTPMFHQIEGLLVDQSATFTSLKATLLDFFRFFFEQELSIRMRPSFFPFTEPSAEVDISCVQCHGAGCRVCSNTGWLEVLGCGMVHPKVLEGVGLDPTIYRGWAFGLGVDRLTMLKYAIDDLRILFEGDIGFLQQFSRSEYAL